MEYTWFFYDNIATELQSLKYYLVFSWHAVMSYRYFHLGLFSTVYHLMLVSTTSFIKNGTMLL